MSEKKTKEQNSITLTLFASLVLPAPPSKSDWKKIQSYLKKKYSTKSK